MTRRLALTLLVAGAATIAVAALLRWGTATYTDELRGPVTLVADGRQLAPALLPLAGTAVAALGAWLAAGRRTRPVVGLLIVVLAAAALWIAVAALVGTPPLLPAGQSGTSQSALVGPLVATLGGAELLVAAVSLLIVGQRPGPSAPIRRAPLAADGTDPGAAPDPERAALSVDPEHEATRLWRALDAHQDPTLERDTSDSQRRTLPARQPREGGADPGSPDLGRLDRGV